MTQTDIPLTDVPEAIGKEPDLGIRPPTFVQCDTYKTFFAEVAVIDGDFVFHFFLPKEGVVDYGWYWEDYFPHRLDEVARTYFKAEFPHLKATHINELGINSWWLRAYGFADRSLDPDRLIAGFYEKLSQALARTNRT